MNLQLLSDLTSQSVDWLWPGRLALGKLAMLDGDPGLGKSFLALDLCARLTTGRPFPDDTPGPGPASCLILNAEDSPADTTRPRLQSLGADLQRIWVLRPDDRNYGPPLRLPSQLEMLDAALDRTSARLVVLDPVVAFLDPGACDTSSQGIRRALLPLTYLAERRRCTVLLIRHLNKKSHGRALYRGSGSIGFLASCRSGWLVAPDPNESDRRVLAQVKNNLAPPQPSLAFTLQGADGSSPNLCWLGKSAWTADDLLARRPDVLPQTPRDRAERFLSEFLASGPRTSREIWIAARPHGLARRTLFRARRALMIRVQRVQEGLSHQNWWLLPDQRLPPTIDPVDDLEPWFADLRAKYPPSTPLDQEED